MRMFLGSVIALAALGGSPPVEAEGRFDPARALGVATGFISHQLCGAAFISGIDAPEFYAQAIEPALGLAAPLFDHRIDREARSVSARFVASFETTSIFRGAAGCSIRHGEQASEPEVGSERAQSSAPPLAGPAVVASDNPAIEAAISRAFEEPAIPPHRWTKAVVILHEGHVIAERYAPGYGVDTPMLGWSMTKSVVNALIGILVRQGKLSVAARAPISAWKDPADPRSKITIDQLLRMESGLDIGESLYSRADDAFNPASQMLYDEADMAAFAERAPLVAEPGARWTYTNGNTQLLCAVIRDLALRDGDDVLKFARRELFSPLGMRRATLELDGAGSPIGSAFMWATARDWARLGLLYLDDGVVGGRRILPPGWADYSARPTPSASRYGYGAGFWTNRDSGEGARRRIDGGMPSDAFMARGSQGQYVVIVPSKRLVVVRMGYAWDESGDVDAVSRLVGDVVRALERRD
jgi:CubicO group peptidase (beta-lactamase class C family)